MQEKNTSPLIFTLATLVALSASGCGVDTSLEADAPPTEAEVDTAITESGLHGLSGILVPPSNPLTKAIYKHESKRWIRWALEQPWTTGPVTDPTGAHCGDGQQGPVWFLAGTPGGDVERSCTIPRGKVLFFPLLNYWITPPPEYVDTAEEIAEIQPQVEQYLADDRTYTCELYARVDGVPVRNSLAAYDQLWVEILTPFTLEFEEDNYLAEYGVGAGTMPAAWTAGHYVMLTPLSPGHHVIELGGIGCDYDGVTPYFEVSARYEITVQH